jgi:hypothetical protein
MMFGVHPSRIPALLRFAVNQEHCIAASSAVEHLTKISPEVLQVMLEQQQQIKERLQQPRFEDDEVAETIRDYQPRQQLLERHEQQQQQITPQLLEELLLLAATRQNYAVLIQLLEMLPTVSLQLPSAAVASLLGSVIRSKIKPP